MKLNIHLKINRGDRVLRIISKYITHFAMSMFNNVDVDGQEIENWTKQLDIRKISLVFNQPIGVDKAWVHIVKILQHSKFVRGLKQYFSSSL